MNVETNTSKMNIDINSETNSDIIIDMNIDMNSETNSETNSDIDMYNIFVLCGGKCGGSTLASTFLKNNYSVIHLHTLKIMGLFNENLVRKDFDIYKS